MNTPPTPARSSALVRRVWKETPLTTGVLLEVEPKVAEAYARPGQYLVVHGADGKKTFLVIASAPGEAQGLELLLGETSASKLALQEGAKLEIDAPTGKGFGHEVARGKDLLIFATGTGIAAVRPVIESVRRQRNDYGLVTAYYGVRTEAEFAYRASFDGWARDRIELVRTISKPWVQDVFRAKPAQVAGAYAVICGQKDMIEQTTAALVAAGMPQANVLKNF